jgi:hypothetical protein
MADNIASLACGPRESLRQRDVQPDPRGFSTRLHYFCHSRHALPTGIILAKQAEICLEGVGDKMNRIAICFIIVLIGIPVIALAKVYPRYTHTTFTKAYLYAFQELDSYLSCTRFCRA